MRIFHLTVILRIKGIIASSSSKVVKEEDRRPPEEYDEPWDHKLKKPQKPDTSGTGMCSLGCGGVVNLSISAIC